MEILYLDANDLEGEIPPELGGLTNLRRLWLERNQLTGEIPPELGSLSDLAALRLHRNELTGQLPASLLSLSLADFWWNANAGLCAPNTSAFRTWLAAIANHQPGPYCSDSDAGDRGGER